MRVLANKHSPDTTSPPTKITLTVKIDQTMISQLQATHCNRIFEVSDQFRRPSAQSVTCRKHPIQMCLRRPFETGTDIMS
ncbi:MAG: hypothetical protein CMM05_04030 [Rhodopirellula sp.]|nr:hypothetical protein [Rhodopirellula sp.]